MRKVIIISAILILSLSSCFQDKEGAKELLMKKGYTDIKLTGFCYLECGDDDFYHTGFKAKDPVTGNIVEGCVCEGMFKGSTIRFE